MRPGSQQPILKMFTKAFKGTVSQRHVNSYSPNTGLHFAFLKKVLGFKNLNNLENQNRIFFTHLSVAQAGSNYEKTGGRNLVGLSLQEQGGGFIWVQLGDSVPTNPTSHRPPMSIFLVNPVMANSVYQDFIHAILCNLNLRALKLKLQREHPSRFVKWYNVIRFPKTIFYLKKMSLTSTRRKLKEKSKCSLYSS